MKKGRLHISAVEIQFVEGRIRVCGGDGEQVGAIQAGAQDAVRSLFSGDHVPSTCTRKSSSFWKQTVVFVVLLTKIPLTFGLTSLFYLGFRVYCVQHA
jgi:hypothetical protein